MRLYAPALDEIVRDLEYVPKVVQPEIADVAQRTLAAGAAPPITYIGAGMTSVVFCDARGVGFKTARRVSPTLHSYLSDEAEWLATASVVPWVQGHVAAFYHFDPTNLVIVRECVHGRQGGDYRWRRDYDLWTLHQQIGKTMEAYGWSAPEYKDDSYVFTRERGPVLVDASMPHRIGRRMVQYILDVMAGRRPWGNETPLDLAFYLRREVQEGAVPAHIAKPIEARLAAMGGRL